ncbi:MAG: hypothetical protein JJU36_05465 [Phycisphaeraceae bacterium]|nr:hypothetical protein [Phycisphaeraceae bacterium]
MPRGWLPGWSQRVGAVVVLALLGVLGGPLITHAEESDRIAATATRTDTDQAHRRFTVAGMDIRLAHVGLANHVRPGCWFPVRLVLENPGLVSRRVHIALVVRDADGDEVYLSRGAISLAAGEEQRELWLYGKLPPFDRLDQPVGRLRISDADTGEVLGVVPVLAQRTVPVFDRVMAVSGSRPLGLQSYRSVNTQHEASVLLEEFDLRTSADRWQGLTMLETVVWLPGGTDPMALSSDTADAIVEWVRRGGHLVVSVGSTVDRLWEGLNQRSALRPLVEGITLEELDQPEPIPAWLGPYEGEAKIDFLALTMDESIGGSAGMAVAVNGAGRPIVGTRSLGIGRVTVIGVNLEDRRLAERGLPNAETFWNRLFAWRSPLIGEQDFEAGITQGRYFGPEDRRVAERGTFVADLINMRGSVSTQVGLAILLFVIYGAVAGPLGFTLLRRRGLKHLAWPGFAVLVVVFSGLLWGWASLNRLSEMRVSHFSILTIDAAGGDVHVRGWASLFAPSHEPVQLRLGEDAAEAGHILWNNTHTSSTGRTTPFVDSRIYQADARSLHRLELPMRSTARGLEIDYRASSDGDAFARRWGTVEGEVRRAGDHLSGTIRHHLPVALKDVILIHSRGLTEDGEWIEPRVWPLYDFTWSWQPGEELDLDRLTRSRSVPLVSKPFVRAGRRSEWDDASDRRSTRLQPIGFLDALTSDSGGESNLAMAAITKRIEMLSLFSTLPPPDIHRSRETYVQAAERSVGFRRTTLRHIDLTPHLAMNRLVIIGHARTMPPLPAPLKVDGREVERVDENSWIVVRMLIPVRE